MQKFQPKDVVAIVVLVGITVLKLRGIDGQLDAVGALILGYYFAHRKNGDDRGT